MAGMYGVKRFSQEGLPPWQWSRLASPDSFADTPPAWENPPEEVKETAIVPEREPKEEKTLFHFARVKTQHCVDGELSFCETLAVVYDRISEDLGEKVFLRGEGKAFMSGFMECSDERLLKEDFKFAVEVSGLSYEQRLDIFSILRVANV